MKSNVIIKDGQHVVKVVREVRYELEGQLVATIALLQEFNEAHLDASLEIEMVQGCYESDYSEVTLIGYRYATTEEIDQYKIEAGKQRVRNSSRLKKEREEKKLAKMKKDQDALERAMIAFPEKFK